MFSYHCLQKTEPSRTTQGCFIAALEYRIIMFFYQNIGPVWMLVLYCVFTKMAVEIPNAAIHHILDRQASWEEQTHIKSSAEYLNTSIHQPSI